MGNGASNGVRLGWMGARHGSGIGMGDGVDMGGEVGMGACAGGAFAEEEDGGC